MLKDRIYRLLSRKDYIPEGVLEWVRYSRDYGAIKFEFEKGDGYILARSTNFRFGSIVTSGKDLKELDRNIRDAILTAFQIPSSFEDKAEIQRRDEERVAYAAA